MEEEEDDVFEPDPHCWRTTFREIKCEDRGTQTPGLALAPNNGMLPCGVAEEPRPLFYGEANNVFFQKRKRSINLCTVTSVIKLKYETIMWDSMWEKSISVAALIFLLAPGSRDHSSFYGPYRVYPAALYSKGARLALWLTGHDRSAHLYKHRLHGDSKNDYQWQLSCSGAIYKQSYQSSCITTDWPQISVMWDCVVCE